MAATAGKKALLKVATTAISGPYTKAANIDSMSFEIDGQTVDVSQLGDDYMSKVQAMKDGKGSGSGNYDMSDTTGQVAMRSSLVNDTAIYLQCLPDGTTGFQFQAKITKMGLNATTSGKASVSFDYEQTGGVTVL